jgi:hypothetical protein
VHGSSTEATRGCGGVSHVFDGLISMFVFDILHIPSGRIEICSGRTAHAGTPLDMGLITAYSRCSD